MNFLHFSSRSGSAASGLFNIDTCFSNVAAWKFHIGCGEIPDNKLTRAKLTLPRATK
jgi:hypothetical protein